MRRFGRECSGPERGGRGELGWVHVVRTCWPSLSASPQLLESSRMLAHLVPQRRWPAPHMQMPPMHISPLPGKHCRREAWSSRSANTGA